MKRKKTFLTTVPNTSVIKEMTANFLQGFTGGKMASSWVWNSTVEASGKGSEATFLRN